MPGDNGGVFISLDAMERQEEEKRAKLQAEEDGKRSAEEALSKVEHASDMYWAYNLYVLGCGPAMLALVTVSVGTFVHKVSVRCTQQPLESFVLCSVILAYAYLFLYTWMLLGPIPFRGRMQPLKLVFLFVAIAATALNSVGALLVFSGSSCAEQAPVQFRFCLAELAMFAVGVLSACAKFLNEALKARLEKKKQQHDADMKKALLAAAEQEDDDDDEEEADDDVDDVDEEDEDEVGEP